MSKQSLQMAGKLHQRKLVGASLLKIYVVLFLFSLNKQPCLSVGLAKCPGSYCGRTVISGSMKNVTECGKCPRGYRTDGHLCLKCNSNLLLYDWLYVGFMVFLIPVVNCHFVNFFEPKRAAIALLHLGVIAEGLISVITAILVMEPVGKLSLRSCRVDSIKDWYTIFYNPKPDYVHEIHCTQEAVFPLYTIIFIYQAGCLLLLLTMRQFLIYFVRKINGRSLSPHLGRKSTYASMYFLPIMSVIHAIFSGVIYYSFPYLLLVASSIGTAFYLSKTLKSWKNIRMFIRVVPVITLLTYCLGNAYGIISITLLQNPVRDSVLLILVFLPALFYFVTYKLTDPEKLS